MAIIPHEKHTIGKKTATYTLVHDSGRVLELKYGKMHISANKYYCDELGDDLCKAVFNAFGVNSSVTLYFKFNGLIGANIKVRYTQNTVFLDRFSFTVDMYINGYESNNNSTNRWSCSGVLMDSGADWNTSRQNWRGGMFLCYMDNNVNYEGVSVYPFMFPTKVANNKFVLASGVVYPYEQIMTYGALYNNVGDGIVYTSAGSSFVSLPSANLLRNYHTLSFQDSGDISKQTASTEAGFPYSQDGSTESYSKGGSGTMTDTSTNIVVDEAKTLYIGGLYDVFKLDAAQLTHLSAFLLSDDFLNNVKKLFTDPMDYIISLLAMPFSATGTPTIASIGGVDNAFSGDRLNNFIFDLSCGKIAMTEYFQTFMDYSPYTKITLYLPFIGYVNLNVDTFQNDEINIKYRIDILTGQCVAFVSNSKCLITTYSGNCGYHIPLRSRDYAQMFSGLLNIAGNAIAGNYAGIAQNVVSGNIKVGGSVTTSGAIGGNTGILTNRKPYIIIERPTISLPNKYNSNIGYMSRIYARLGDLQGFTIVEACHLDNVIATMEEKAEIERMLKNGIIL